MLWRTGWVLDYCAEWPYTRGIAMSIKIRIPSPLRNFTNGIDVVEVSGLTVGEALEELKA